MSPLSASRPSTTAEGQAPREPQHCTVQDRGFVFEIRELNVRRGQWSKATCVSTESELLVDFKN